MVPSPSAGWRRIAVAAAVAALLAGPAGATLYKWVDANGRTVYSDQPPPGNVKTEIVGTAPPAANPDAVKEMANQEAEFRKRQSERAEDAKKAGKARADAQQLAGFCANARSQIAALRATQVEIYRLNEKGERYAVDAKQRQIEADRLAAMLRERNCPPAPPG